MTYGSIQDAWQRDAVLRTERWWRGAVWLGVVSFVVLAWLAFTAIATVAIPRHCAAAGLSEHGWWQQALSAWVFGQFYSLVVFDLLKCLLVMLTGPRALAGRRLPGPHGGRCLRDMLRHLHVPLAWLF